MNAMRYAFIALGALFAGVCTARSEPVPALKSGEKWLAVASTKDIDTAKGIADYYGVTGVRVMSAADGWFAVVLGPFKAQSVDQLKTVEQALATDLPQDALLSDGKRYLEQVWQEGPDKGEEGPLVEYAVGKPARLSTGPLSIEVSLSGDEDNPGPTTITGRETGNQAFTFSTSNEFVLFGSSAGLLRLDPSTEHPQLVVTRFTGGAHCCTMTWIVTKPKGAASWTMIDGLMLDGEGYGFKDVDGDGSTELINVDNNFLYGFASYAESFSVTRYSQIRGGKLVDVTATSAFRPFVKQHVAWMDFSAKINPDLWKSNGFLAAWVAAKNLIGEGDEAWAKMEKTYERTSDFGPQECTTGQKIEDCPAENLKPIPFPKALAEFLRDRDYGPLPDAARSLLQ